MDKKCEKKKITERSYIYLVPFWDTFMDETIHSSTLLLGTTYVWYDIRNIYPNETEKSSQA